MIKVRLNVLSEGTEIEGKESETLKELVYRVLENNGHKEINENVLEHITVLINGLQIDSEMWPIVTYKDTDEVLVASVIKGGDFGQIFKQVAIIAVTIVASILLSPGAGATFGASLTAALEVAAITVATTLALNALIPPPNMGNGGGIGIDGSSLEQSQMYSITGQANRINKYGFVPKVYGTHKVFPILAANPYTEIEADSSTGTLVQFFYCIYDFGFGPLEIQDIKIGETPITDFADVSYNFVDFNKPAVSEGPWDDYLSTALVFYKGDIQQDSTTVGINKNREVAGTAVEDYEVVRNASSAVNGCDQEIILDFICPQGLIAYGSNGDASPVNIDLEIYFSKVGEDNWIPFNDKNYVKNYQYAGGADAYSLIDATPLPLITTNYVDVGLVSWNLIWTSNGMASEITSKFGYPVGTDTFVLSNNSGDVGAVLRVNGKDLGIITSITPHSTGFSNYKIDTPLAESITAFTYHVVNNVEAPMPPETVAFPANFQTIALILGKARITRKETSAVYSTVKFSPKDIAQYKVRVTRVRTFSDSSFQVLSNLTLASLVTRFDRNPILTTERHVFLEIKIRATNQLNGAIQNLSAVTSSVLDAYDPDTQTWSKKVTANPAWVFCDLLTGPINKRAIAKSRLHMDSIVEWANFADAIPTAPTGETFLLPRFQSNFVLDFDATLQQALNLVCNAAQASLNITDGKYGVLLDKLKTTPVQIFTPRNILEFSSSRSYVTPPDALKIKYVDPNADWQVRERIVYENGFTEDTALTFQELDSFGCTNPEQAWRFGRYMMAQANLRQEQITITVDFEYLICTRGDYVRFVQDVMKVGGRAARVKTISGNRITIDDAIDTIGGVDYGYMFRSPTGIYNSTLTVIDAETFDLDGTLPAIGDLIVIGEVDFVYMDCIVKSISPQGDLTAQLTLVEKADAIYSAESTGTIPPYSPQIAPTEDTEFSPPGEVVNLVVTANTYRCLGSSYQYYIGLDWDVPTGAAFERFEIYADKGRGYDLIGFTKESLYEYIVDPAYLSFVHKFKVLALSATGKKLDLGSVGFVTATPVSKTSPPTSVAALYLNVTDQTIQLDWSPITDCDVAEYIIRFSPVASGSWESSIPLLRADRNSTLAHAQSRTGTYLIKAVDFNGNESTDAAIAITSIPELTGLNFIEETNDFPALQGNLVQTVIDGGALELQKVASGDPTVNEYYSEGYYYFKDFLDLGEIYTVRLQSLIEAEGFTADDIMSNWTTLDDVDAISGAKQADWDVETHFRTTEAFNVMSEWTSLDLVDPISDGQIDNWTPWRKFTIGDFTGRIFEFRLKLISNKASVTPRVFNGVIRSDMPDRIETFNNLTAIPSGYNLVYSPAFKGPGSSPNVQITQDAAQSGDYPVITSKTLNGCTITFYDKNNIAVTRTFDVAVKGYGRKATAVI